MDSLISLENVCLAYGLDVLLDDVKFQVSKGERVCLIGRNGAGKSSLLKIIDGVNAPDSGSVWKKPGLRLARLTQEFPDTKAQTVFEFVAEGLSEAGQLLTQYHELTQQIASNQDGRLLQKLEKLQQKIEAIDAWHFDNEINTVLSRLDLKPDVAISSLSGGWKRRAALARALVISPDLLLLDEPTNHLDIDAIEWLEQFLLSSKTTLIFITHDRALLQRLATRIIELDRGQLTSWPGDYQNFLQRKEEALAAEQKQHAEFDKKLAQEEKWVRQGIKARRTRNEGRVRALKDMRVERAKRRTQQGKVNLNVNQADVSGKLVIEAQEISYSVPERELIKNFSVSILRGDRVGLIGPNGVGKTTLLNILLGKLTPTNGQLKLGTKLQVAYFDQMRAALDLNKTVAENVTLGGDMIEIDGRQVHVISYLSDFLFSPQRARTPVKALSGGECNRLLLARLFSQPSNLLVMDEPTNDLDIETLELLENVLSQYQGTLLLVSHDRQFLDNVVTSTLVFEGEGIVQEYIGGYEDWLLQRPELEKLEQERTEKVVVNKKARRKRKLTFNETRELEALPGRIEDLEVQLGKLQELVANPDFYQKPHEEVTKQLESLKNIEIELKQAYERWDELDSL